MEGKKVIEMADYYLWFKAFHILSVITWMAGLLYLPRLFVYHAEAGTRRELSDTFKIMERRLLHYIINPSLAGALIFGGLMVATPGAIDIGAFWFWIKLTMVVILIFLNVLFAIWQKQFELNMNTKSPRFYRIWNEAPTIPLIIIVIMAVVKPI